jgi:SAM-dependent methyltransferase
MERWQPETYGDTIADVYDDLYTGLSPSAAAAFLASEARGGPVLELGIGTGRVALPLAAHGLTVKGIDASTRMVERLRAKPGGDTMAVTIGDFSSFDLGEQFTLVYVVFNTIFVLLTQEEQVECFRSVAAHLAPGGRFVVECFVPDVTRYEHGSHVNAVNVGVDAVRIDATVHDAATQTVRTQHIAIRDGQLRMLPVTLRYIWPSELDLMARLAGFECEVRYAGWNREPFTSAAENQVAVYVRSDGPA